MVHKISPHPSQSYCESTVRKPGENTLKNLKVIIIDRLPNRIFSYDPEQVSVFICGHFLK